MDIWVGHVDTVVRECLEGLADDFHRCISFRAGMVFKKGLFAKNVMMLRAI